MFKKKKDLIFPEHIAFIMDGNRRWAVSHGLGKMAGHKHGAIALKNLIDVLAEIEEIKFASFFAFSTENWKRDRNEIDYIFQLVRDLVCENEQKYVDKNIKFVAMGDISRFPEDLQHAVLRIVEKTKSNTGLVVNMALGYGGKDDIIQAANKVFDSGEKVTEQNLKANLYAGDIPDIDLLIRTSGEQRISNFMLFYLAYSELYFTKTYWPDFDKKELFKAIEEFSYRDRRYGGK